MKYLLCALVLLSCAVSGFADENDFLSRDIRARLLVQDPGTAVRALVDWTEERGGYFVYRSPERVELRVPAEYAQDVRLLMEDVAGEVLELSLEARDLRQRFVQVNAGLKSRKEILSRNIAYLRRADLDATLAIEQEISRLMSEIEQLEGELRGLKRDRAYALVVVSLSSQGQELPVDLPSPFGWIDGLDFYRYMEETGR